MEANLPGVFQVCLNSKILNYCYKDIFFYSLHLKLSERIQCEIDFNMATFKFS